MQREAGGLPAEAGRRLDLGRRGCLSLLGPGLSAAGTDAGPHLVALAALARLVLAYTRSGYGVYAVGGNPEAARLSGLGVDRITLAVYVITGGWADSSSPPA